jgi:hypothetical protein
MKVMASSPMKVQQDKPDRRMKQKQVDSNERLTESYASCPLSPQHDRILENLHASYGSLNNSYGNLNASATSLGNYYDTIDGGDDVFFSPQQATESPWKLKKKTKLSPFPASNMLALSPPPRLQKVAVGPKGDWAHPSASSLVADFNPSSPKESPLRRRQTIKSPLPVSKPKLTLPVVSTPVETKKKKKTKSEGTGVADPAVTKTPASASKKKVKKVTVSVAAAPAAPGICSTKPIKTPIRKQKRFTPPKYGSKHENAASIIAALARGRRDRLKAKIRRLERRLRMIKVETAADIEEIVEQTKQDKKEFKQRAKERFMKNLGRKGEQDSHLEDAHETIARLRKQNAQVREQNVKMAKDIAALRVNNDRLTTSQEATESYLVI